MKAWRLETHNALNWIDLPEPEPQAMEARVRVQAVGINHLDVWVKKGVPGHKFPLPLIPGSDVSGTIESFGPGSEAALASSGLGLGSEVVVSPGISCGRCKACLGGFDPLCRQYGIIGETRDGGCAEYIVVPIANLIPKPIHLSFAEAASIPIPFLTAWTMLIRKASLQAGETVLIHAAGSGVSIAATQMAKMIGATVIVTASSDDKLKKAQALGADYVINYKNSPFRSELKKILSPLKKTGVDLVVDHVGSETFQESLKSLAWGGKLATCGATSGAEVTIDLKLVFFKNISILGATMGSKGDLLKIFELLSQNRLKPVLHATYPMKDLPQAMSVLENRQSFGKVILTA